MTPEVKAAYEAELAQLDDAIWRLSLYQEYHLGDLLNRKFEVLEILTANTKLRLGVVE